MNQILCDLDWQNHSEPHFSIDYCFFSDESTFQPNGEVNIDTIAGIGAMKILIGSENITRNTNKNGMFGQVLLGIE